MKKAADKVFIIARATFSIQSTDMLYSIIAVKVLQKKKPSKYKIN